MSEPHSFPVTVYYEDTDMAGIVYYANYLRYIERARSTIVEELGLDQRAMREMDIVFVVTRVEADYVSSARLGDRLTVQTRHYAKGPVRWIFEQEVLRGDTLIFKALVTAATMSTGGKPMRLPAELRSRLGG
ncbi:YbgC/FadM family acyl-CoA thioesterase [Aliishimia ponticola]|uniref:YbgC/FadM family acyl-CoA thioesterase n=1 Tax=Aliishimia ponticola TaxID=2499833 RepID=A0A4S4NCP4_9RHOB|nr:YbgC/FadM family acyl-CoA thioesterase [Aliishimia ponticola]THH37216.1 YbgC/FadM family acyl-CoA thioesterase [Aliishimia ponticola]